MQEAFSFSDPSVNFYHIIRPHTPEDYNRQSHFREVLGSIWVSTWIRIILPSFHCLKFSFQVNSELWKGFDMLRTQRLTTLPFVTVSDQYSLSQLERPRFGSVPGYRLSLFCMLNGSDYSQTWCTNFSKVFEYKSWRKVLPLLTIKYLCSSRHFRLDAANLCTRNSKYICSH
jgi:hypothetical protein